MNHNTVTKTRNMFANFNIAYLHLNADVVKLNGISNCCYFHIFFQVKKPSNLKDIQLITAKNQHRFVAEAGVAELTKEEFETFNLVKK